jgi:uncharacterized UBP type Zn finger protein
MSCAHTTILDQPGWSEPEPDSADGCVDCVAAGRQVWSHLRLCLTCGHVGCCDSSPYRDATTHFERSGHPVMRSFEPGERWRWCYEDKRIV